LRRAGRRKDVWSTADSLAAIVGPTIVVVAMMIAIFAADARADRSDMSADCAFDRLDIRR
jgi:hypothetical protein